MLKILKSYTITELRKEISKTNIKQYSKLKKNELIELMMKTPEKFSHLEMKPKKERSEKQKANDKKLGEQAKERLAKKKEPEPVKEPEPEPEPEPVKEEVKEVKKAKSTPKPKPKAKTTKPKAKPKAKPKKEAKKTIFDEIDEKKVQLSTLINKYAQLEDNKADKKMRVLIERNMERIEEDILKLKLKGSKKAKGDIYT